MTDRESAVHGGFDKLLRSMSRDGSEGVSAEMLGRILEDLAVASPAGLTRTQLASKHSPGSLAKALAVLGPTGARLVRQQLSAPGLKGGRRRERYLLGSPYWITFGVHVSIDKGRPVELTLVQCDLSGDVIDLPWIRPLPDREEMKSTQHVWKRLAEEIAQFVGEAYDELRTARPDTQVLGVGVEVPGHVFRGNVLMADHAGYGETADSPIELAAAIRLELVADGHTELADRVILENDVNLITIREAYNAEEPLSSRGAIVAVFDQGVGAGFVTGKRLIFRGAGGGAGEPGHIPVFITRRTQPVKPSKPTKPQRSHKVLTFADPCSCGALGHVDCYATPDRIMGELELAFDPELFAEVAGRKALDDHGNFTREGQAFWTAGEALGCGIMALISSINPNRLLVILPHALAGEDLLNDQDGTGNGTAAGAYRQAIEYVVSSNAMTTTAEDARSGTPRRAGSKWLEVQSLAVDQMGGAKKAARNAALGVVAAFVDHAADRDECVKDKPDLLPERYEIEPGGRDFRELRRLARRDLRDLLVREDPQELDSAYPDEYDQEEEALLHFIMDDKKIIGEDDVLNVFEVAFNNRSRLKKDRGKLISLTRQIVDLQTVYTGRVRLREAPGERPKPRAASA